MRIDEAFIEKLAKYYNSEFVKRHMPWIREIPFDEFVRREVQKRFPELYVKGVA
jgi:hypothetical protein